MANPLADFAHTASKNGADFNCDFNPTVQDKDLCHQIAAGVADQVRENVNDPVGTVAKAAIDGKINDFITNLLQGVTELFHNFISSWLHAGPIIDLNGPGVQWGYGTTKVFLVFALTFGLIMTGLKAAWYSRGEDIKDAIPSVLKVSGVAVAGNVFVATMITASDAAAQWIIDQSAWNSDDTAKVLAGDIGKLVSQYGAMMLLMGGLMGIVVVLQWCVMIFTAIVLPIFVMYWPLSEAMGFAAGQKGFSRTARWILAFILFKPTVALLYGFAFVLMKGDEGLGGFVMGICVIIISIFALPGLLKVVMPASAATGADGGGGLLSAAGKFLLAAAAVGATGGAAGGAAAGGASGSAATNAGAGGAAAGGASGSAASAFQPGASLGDSGQMPGGFSSSGSGGSSSGSQGAMVSQSGGSPLSESSAAFADDSYSSASSSQPEQSLSSSEVGGSGEGSISAASPLGSGTVPVEASPAGGGESAAGNQTSPVPGVDQTSMPSSFGAEAAADYQGGVPQPEQGPVSAGMNDADQGQSGWASRGASAVGRVAKAAGQGAYKAATHPAVLDAANQQARYSKHSAEEKIFDQSQIDNRHH